MPPWPNLSRRSSLTSWRDMSQGSSSLVPGSSCSVRMNCAVAKAVQRGNEHGWWLPPRPSRSVYESGERMWRPKDWWVVNDKAAGEGYDWLRENASDAGALSAKIRAEFTMK
jgi:hypothetical protein